MSLIHTVVESRFLQPWEVLEMDTQDMGKKSSTGNIYPLLVVARAASSHSGTH